MSKTFKDVDGTVVNLDLLMEQHTIALDYDTDIVSGEITGYSVVLDGEPRYEVAQDVYEALNNIIS